MRLRKRLSAAILAIVMMVSSIQIPGGTSYAAEIAGGGITSGQNASILTVEETEGTETVGETQPDDGVVTDGGSQTGEDNPAGDDSQTDDDNPAGDDSQAGEDNPAGDDSQAGEDNPAGDDSQAGDDNLADDDSQTGDDNPAGDDSQMGDDNLADDDSQTDDENDPEEDPDAGQVSGNDLEEPAASEETEEDEAEETERVEVEISGAYQFGGAPATRGRISVFSVSTHSDSRDEYLYQEMLKRNPVIDVSQYGLSWNQADSLVSSVLNEHPDLYFVNKTVGTGVDSTGTKLTELFMYYSNSYDDNAFKAGVDEALSCVDDEMGDLEKVIALHDYLAVNNEYDYKNYQTGTVPDVSYTAYGAFVNRISVCQGYALAYKYLLNKLGIECYMVTSDSMKHAWNMVKLDGEYYHVDVTSDDPVWDRIGRVTHNYLLFSDEGHMEKYYGWKVTFGSNTVNYKATDDSYDLAFWKDSTAPLVINGDDCYYVSGSGSIRKGSCADIANGGPEIANTGSWTTWDNSGTWPGAYSGLYMIDGRLFYNDKSAIYSISTDGTDKQTAFTADTSNGYIYGSAYCQGKVYYALHKTPYPTAKEDVLIAEITGDSGEEVDPEIPPEEISQEGYNITNLEQTYTKTYKDWNDDQDTFSTKADGKPKIVMFYGGSNDKIAAKLFQDIVDHKSYFDFSKVDFSFIDLTGHTDGRQADIDGSWGRNADGTAATNEAYRYDSAVKEKNPLMSNLTPLVPRLFYIDADDKIQYAEKNQTSAYLVLRHLREYCGYTRYAIVYHMDDGERSPKNPEEYEIPSEDMVLTPPYYRDGYRFDGWYSDAAYTKRITKIPAGTKSDLNLYAKWTARLGGFGLENPVQEYKTLDGDTISSTADGKPKLLIFYEHSSDSSEYAALLSRISDVLDAGDEHALKNVDIYAIETGASSWSAVSDDKQSVNDQIVFSYDSDGNLINPSANAKCMEAYRDLVGYIDHPFICYIDAQNRLQYISGSVGADQIMINLRAYCNYPTSGPEFYMIRYELNGGTNNSKNPNRYHNEMDNNITLEDPVRNGYRFDGWYTDAAYTERVTEIAPDRGEDITLYAKWKKKGVDIDNPEYRFVTVDGSANGSQAIDGKPKLLVFANENCGLSRELTKGITEKIDWFERVDIVFAVVTKTNTINANNYIANLKTQYGCDEIVFCTDSGGDASNTIRLNDYINKGNYQTLGGMVVSPVVAYIDGDNKLQYVESQDKAEKAFNNLREYCNYDAYRINYDLGGGTNNSENPEIYFGDSDTITLLDPSRKGFKFEGWYKDMGYTKRVTEITAGSRADYTLYAKWAVRKGGYGLENLAQEYTTLDETTVTSTASGKPKVLIFGTYGSDSLATLNDVKSELDKSDSLLHGVDIYLVGTGGKNVILNLSLRVNSDEIIYTYDKDGDNSEKKEAYKKAAECDDGYFYDPTIVYIDENNTLQYVYPGKPTNGSAPTAADIIANLKKYCNYPSYAIYKITYELDGGTNSSENPATYSAQTETITLADAVREGYAFEGWYSDAEFNEPVTQIVKGSTGDITLYAKWRDTSLDPKTYQITYELNGGTNSSENPETYTSETETITLEDAVKAGFIFEGWYQDAEFTVPVSEIVTGSTGDITLYAKWRADEVNGLGIDNLDQTYRGLDNKTLSSEADGKPKLLIFFTTSSVDSQNTFNNIKEVAGNLAGVDVYAIEMWQASQSAVYAFKNSYGCDEITFAYDDWSTTSNYDKAVAYRDIAGLSGMYAPIICYIDKDNKLQWVTDREKTGEEILENLKKYCNYPPQDQETYQITYMLDGGTNDSGNPSTYTELTYITLKDAFKEGYIFDGWYQDAEFEVRVTEIVQGSTGNITLYAKWVEKSNIQNLEYTFTTIDDQTVSSKADGKPKVLFFFRPNCYYCQQTNANLSDHIDEFTGVDIYAVEITGVTKDEVSEFKNVYGCDEITYCYDKDGKNNSALWAYYRKFESGGQSVTTPVIAFIDAENKLQHVSTGMRSWSEVLDDLKKYCNYPPQGQETYQIIYELNGGTNSSGNPETYTSETDTIILEDAVKEGYIFAGWYSDAEFNEQVTQIVTGSIGDITLYAKWSLAEFIVSIKRPDRTTYKVGEEPDVTGGKVILTDRTDESIKEEKDMELSMLEGFDSSEPGICMVTVACDGYTGSFEALIVDEPEVTVESGQKLGSAVLPKNEYGTYAWADDVDLETELNEAGIHTYGAVFTPNDTEKFQTLPNLQIQVRVARKLDNDCVKMEFLDGPYTYRGEQIKPKVKVTYIDSEGEEVTLIEGQDYELDYDENLTEYGVVHVTGINDYTGTVSDVFDIGPAKRTIRALDKVILVGSEIPTEFEYEIVGGLYEGDELLVPPRFECDITSTAEEGEYDIRVSGASVGSLIYLFQYEKGTLYVVSEAATCKVTFDVQGHGTAPKAIAGVSAGDTIDSPEEPSAEGYRFDGWYKDTACTKAWDFEMDTVQSDLTLYAKWFGIDKDGEFAVQEIADVYYTGKAQKPAVSVYDENTLLKAGKDYTVKYYNNTDANAGGVLKGEEFNSNLPYVAITGKGNYKETVRINFNILRASIGDDFNPAAGVTLKVNDQLVQANKAQKPFGSLKYGKNLKEGTDYELELWALFANDGSGKPVLETNPYSDAKVPANYTGQFMLTVTGKGNYTGSISRMVYVADKAHLMKNVKITLGKDLKNIDYTGSRIELKAAEKLKPENDEFVVTYGSTVLRQNEDYYVTYNNNVGVGKAELVVTGTNGYLGKKTATFNIKGKKFANGTVEVTGLQDQAYTGRAIVQNKNAVLAWKADGNELVYGRDYTISYSKNINKGTATMTFTGIAEAGYSGKISKKFKITAADIADQNKVTRDESMDAITLPYSKAGVKPVEEIILTNEKGIRLRNGKDYTLAYKNNKAVANAGNAPTVTVQGKGNYRGSFDVYFTIERADLRGGNITIECAQVSYNSNKPADYEYKPAVTVKDGKSKLKAGTDYEISYVRNTQADFEGYLEDYLEDLMWGWSMSDAGRPMAVITAKEGSTYTLQGQIEVPLQIYTEKLTRSNLDVEIDEAVYTGGQVRPKVTVTYKGESLKEGVDYKLVYGANTASGKNKGSVTIKGLAPKYGGSVAYKFEIIKKDLKYRFLPVINEK